MNGKTDSVETAAGCGISDDVWFQITFTLDPKNYKRLWAHAESVNQGVAWVVREKILDFLKDLRSSRCQKHVLLEKNSEKKA